jgi:DNA-binding transcriptional regulator YdaS (Cro superfamily)
MFNREVYAGVFQRSAELIGGMPELAAHLGVSPGVLEGWAAGRTEPPPEMFLRAVDIHVEYTLKGLISSVSRRSAGEASTSD